MSHLAHIIKVKETMSAAGITSPHDQSAMLTEAYVRAVVRFRYNGGNSSWNEGVENRTWAMLDKWNCVTPIQAQLIHTTAQTRCNELLAALANEGIPPCRNQYRVMAEVGAEKEPLDITTWPCYIELVNFLYKEMEAGNE